MKRSAASFLLALLIAANAPAWARPAAIVEGVQMPAWIEREAGRRAPLAPGMELRAGDHVRTGGNARLLVKLAEGSLVKLGENGSLRLAEIDPGRGGVFSAALGVAEGAFRFTTDVLRKAQRRNVRINVGTVTAGIRGTDLWGKSETADRQIVCLIEGVIEVAAPGETPLRLDQPRQFYQRERGVTAPVGFVDPAQLAEWAKETEIAAGAGAARRGGRFRVVLAQALTQEAALAVYDRARDAGYAARIYPRRSAGQYVYDVAIASLPSRAEAQALADRLKGRHDLGEPKVSG